MSYSEKTYKGNAATWQTDALFSAGASDSFPHDGEQAARTNKSGMGYLEMAGDKANGAGNISFWGRVYKTDPDGKFTVKVSTDGGTTWTEAGNVTVSGDTYKKLLLSAKL